MWQVQMTFLVDSDQIWVARLDPNDPIYEYDNEADANTKCDELQNADTSGRKYRVQQIQ